MLFKSVAGNVVQVAIKPFDPFIVSREKEHKDIKMRYGGAETRVGRALSLKGKPSRTSYGLVVSCLVFPERLGEGRFLGAPCILTCRHLESLDLA